MSKKGEKKPEQSRVPGTTEGEHEEGAKQRLRSSIRNNRTPKRGSLETARQKKPRKGKLLLHVPAEKGINEGFSGEEKKRGRIEVEGQRRASAGLTKVKKPAASTTFFNTTEKKKSRELPPSIRTNGTLGMAGEKSKKSCGGGSRRRGANATKKYKGGKGEKNKQEVREQRGAEVVWERRT